MVFSETRIKHARQLKKIPQLRVTDSIVVQPTGKPNQPEGYSDLGDLVNFVASSVNAGTGSGTVKSVNLQSPNTDGDVTLTPQIIGADPAGTATAEIASLRAEFDPFIQYQVRDEDLTAISGLSTTLYGRNFLELAGAAPARAKLGLGNLSTLSTITSANITGTLPWAIIDKTGAIAADIGAVANTDLRLFDSRIPMGGAGGDLAGSYPNPTLASADLRAISLLNTGGGYLRRSSTTGAWVLGQIQSTEVKIPTCQAFNSTSISIPNATTVTLPLDSTRWDNDNIRSGASNSQLVCQTLGYYNVFATVYFTENATGNRAVYILLNGSLTVAIQTVTNLGGSTATVVSTSNVISLTPGDIITLAVRQTSGANLNVEIRGYSPIIGMNYIGKT